MLPVVILITSALLIIISGVAKGGQDLLSHNKYNLTIFSKFKNQDYWNPLHSWKNKYKERGETWFINIIEIIDNSFLVTFTDGWHTLQFFNYRFLAVGMALLGSVTAYYILLEYSLWTLCIPLVGMGLHSGIFYISYHYILRLSSKRKIYKKD